MAVIAIAAAASPSGAGPRAPARWTARPGTTVTADGALVGHVCCTGQLYATRPLALPPAGGTIEVAARAPCGDGVAIGVRAGGTTAWATGPRGAAPFVGTVALRVAAVTGPRELVVVVEGGLQCCGDARVEPARVAP